MKQIFLACLWLTVFQSQAQTVNITFSNKFSLRDRGLTQKEGGTLRIGSSFYCMEMDYKGMQLAYTAKLDKVKYDVNIFKFDQDMKLVNKVALDGQWRLGPFPPQGVVFGGRILVFYYQVKESGSIQLMFSAVDPETLSVSPGKELYVISERNVGIFKLDRVFKSNKLRFEANPAGTKLIVSQSGNTDEFCSIVIDTAMNFDKPVISRVKGDLDFFAIEQASLDNAGNRYFIYSYGEDRLYKFGIIVQNTDRKEAYLSFRTMQDALEAGMLWLKPSKDDTKMYVYGICTGEKLDEGVLLTTVDAAKLKLGKPQVVPYPQDLREKLEKMDFAEKNHGNLSVKKAYYVCNELEDGTLALTGYPINTIRRDRTEMIGMNAGSTSTVVENYAGPIINIFLKDGKSSFGVIYRNQAMSNASGVVVIPYHDKLVCIYNDNEKSIVSDDLRVNGKKYDLSDLVIASAVVGSDGTVISRKKLADKEGHLCYFTDDQKPLSATSCIIPLGKDKFNAIRYYTEFEQWATVEVN